MARLASDTQASGRGFFAPMYEGVLEHRQKIGSALWAFVLLINWTTKEVPDPDCPGEYLGIVRGGKPIAAREIAAALHESVDSTKEHLARLEKGGYIVRTRELNAYTYAVKRSKKWSCRSFACEAPDHTGEREISTVAGGKALDSREVLPPYEGENATSYKEEDKENKENKENKPDLSLALESVFEYYLQKVGRNPKTYDFTAGRRKKGMARLQECLKKTGGNLENAVGLMRLSVDCLASSDWHTGRDPQTHGKKYCDWEGAKYLFGSYSGMERWWNQ